jgi:hypothetical protein
MLRRLVPTEHEVPGLLEQVSTAARRAGLDLGGVAPEPVLAGTQFDTYRYKVTVAGGYHALAAFLGNVGSLPRIVAPVTFQLVPRAAAPRGRPSPHVAAVARAATRGNPHRADVRGPCRAARRPRGARRRRHHRAGRGGGHRDAPRAPARRRLALLGALLATALGGAYATYDAELVDAASVDAVAAGATPPAAVPAAAATPAAPAGPAAVPTASPAAPAAPDTVVLEREVFGYGGAGGETHSAA